VEKGRSSRVEQSAKSNITINMNQFQLKTQEFLSFASTHCLNCYLIKKEIHQKNHPPKELEAH